MTSEHVARRASAGRCTVCNHETVGGWFCQGCACASRYIAGDDLRASTGTDIGRAYNFRQGAASAAEIVDDVRAHFTYETSSEYRLDSAGKIRRAPSTARIALGKLMAEPAYFNGGVRRSEAAAASARRRYLRRATKQ